MSERVLIPLQHLLARRNPSTYKIRYLVHIEDYRSTAHQGVRHGLLVLESVSGWISTQATQRRLWDAGQSFEVRAAELKADLGFICNELAKLEDQILKLKHTLYEYQALKHDRRSFILTLLAAVFLPLSFASTFFGMNMDTTTSSGPRGFSNWTASWINNSPTDIQNSTRALASTIGSSGTLTYSWRTYIITAICLVITLPLSLTIGSIVRTVYRSTAYYVTYWRALAILPSLAFIFFSVFGVFLVIPLFYLWVICNGLLILYLGLRLSRAWRNQQRPLIWIVLLMITAGCFGINMVMFYFPMMMLPWLCFAFTWFWPWWRRRKQEKARKEDAPTNEVEMVPITTSNSNQTVNVTNMDFR